MSARPAFADVTAPRTTFVGGVSPWPEALYVPKKSHKKKPDMSKTKMTTAHLAASPFQSTSVRPQAAAPAPAAPAPAAPKAAAPKPEAKKSGPAPGTLCRGRVDFAALKVEKGVPLPVTRITGGYADLFSGMQPTDSIKCKPAEVVSIANALRKWIKDTKQTELLQVVSEKENPEDPGVGRVWMWPKGDVSALPPKSRGGVARGRQHAAAKDGQ